VAYNYVISESFVILSVFICIIQTINLIIFAEHPYDTSQSPNSDQRKKDVHEANTSP